MLPVIRELAAAGVRTSVDTTRAEVAEAALAAGAELVNDVSGGLADKNMAELVAETGVPWVLMHWRGPQPGDVRGGALRRRRHRGLRRADRTGRGRRRRRRRPRAAGARPGAGLRQERRAQLGAARGPGPAGRPRAAGARRRLPQDVPRPAAGRRRGQPRPAEQRDAATLATTVLAAEAGAWGVRVHDAAASVDAIRTVAAVRGAAVASRTRRRARPDRHPRADRLRPPRRLRRSSAAGADVPRRRRARGGHRARRRVRRPRADGQLRRAGPAAVRGARPASRSTCSRPSPSGWPTSAWPTSWSTRSRSPCTSPRPTSASPSTTSTVTIRRERPMSRAVLSLGANLGDRAAALRGALTALQDDGLVARSTLYETPPWGPVEQPPYLNAIAIVRGDRATPPGGWPGRTSWSRRPGGPGRSAGARARSTSTSSPSPGRRDAGALRRPRADAAASRGPTSGRSCWCRGRPWTRAPSCPAAGGSPI